MSSCPERTLLPSRTWIAPITPGVQRLDACAQLPVDGSAASDLVRKDLKFRIGQSRRGDGREAPTRAEYDAQYRVALRAARQVLLAMRNTGQIGDDAFHTLENDLDWRKCRIRCGSECGHHGLAARGPAAGFRTSDVTRVGAAGPLT